jgi:hypothetical protein
MLQIDNNQSLQFIKVGIVAEENVTDTFNRQPIY